MQIFKVQISFLIISFLYFHSLDIDNIGNTFVSFVNLVSDNNVNDASSHTDVEVVDQVYLEVLSSNVKNPKVNFVEVGELVGKWGLWVPPRLKNIRWRTILLI